MSPKSSFSIVKTTPEIMFLVDQNCGKSVTNDAKAVTDCCHRLDPGKRVVYQDTEWVWSELKHQAGIFTGFADYHGTTP